MAAGTPRLQYKTIFFDNDEEKVGQFRGKPGIIAVKISETYGPVGESDPKSYYFFQELLKNKNTYLAFLRSGKWRDSFDGESGIHSIRPNPDGPPRIPDSIYGFNEDLIAPHPELKYFVFDWDRTLTLFEGVVMTPSTTFDPSKGGYLKSMRDSFGGSPSIQAKIDDLSPVTPEDMLLYLFGGSARLEAIRGWMRSLKTGDRQIIILTNNGSCGNKGFTELVDAFMPGCKIVCSRVAPFYGDKYAALGRAVPVAVSGAPDEGGRRRRKTNTRRVKRGAKSKSRRRRSTFRRSL
jgi:hypothetical protein